MTRLSKCVFILLLPFLALSAHGFQMAPKMECGTYHVTGVLKFNSQGQPLVRIQDRTSSAYELLLIHPSLSQLLRYRDVTVAAEVFVPQKIASNHKPFVIFKRWLSRALPADKAVQLVKSAQCHK